MRRWWIFLGLVLVACGGSSATDTPAVNVAATTTRSVEQTQVAAVLTPAAAGGSAVRPTVAAGSPAGILIPPVQGTQPASASSGSSASGTTAPANTPSSASAATAAPVSAATQVVKVSADDGANVRDKPDTNGQVVVKADYGAELPVLELNVAGADGTSKWVKVSVEGGKTGYIRSDLITGPQAPSPPRPPTATPIPGSTPVPTATAKP